MEHGTFRNNILRLEKRITKYATFNTLGPHVFWLFFVFAILIPSFKLLFVYLMSENADRIHSLYIQP
jgi:hypothetical protein